MLDSSLLLVCLVSRNLLVRHFVQSLKKFVVKGLEFFLYEVFGPCASSTFIVGVYTRKRQLLSARISN